MNTNFPNTGFPDFLPERFRFCRNFSACHLPKREPNQCRWCGKPVPKGRKSWCSDGCVDEFKVRAWPSYISSVIFRRDQGVCEICGIDTVELDELHRKVWRTFKTWNLREAGMADPDKPVNGNHYHYGLQWGPWDPFKQLWEADHIVPVIEGGGCCGLQNYRTLCQLCHKAETAALAKRRAEARALASGRGVQNTLEGVS